tara:strand:+ start:1038 stop:1562 length:525 start_codon:yes stop_codon:yes gene_type:complete
MKKNIKNIALIFIVFFYYFSNSYAINENRKEPIDITADTMEWNDQTMVAHALGNAVATQGSQTLTADELTASIDNNSSNDQDAQRIRMIYARGNVSFENNEEKATGDKGLYDVENGKIILEGNVILKRKNDILYGNKLVMDLDDGKSRVFSESGEGRVKMRFIPAQEKKEENAN